MSIKFITVNFDALKRYESTEIDYGWPSYSGKNNLTSVKSSWTYNSELIILTVI